jgi:hypothetical protein
MFNQFTPIDTNYNSYNAVLAGGFIELTIYLFMKFRILHPFKTYDAYFTEFLQEKFSLICPKTGNIAYTTDDLVIDYVGLPWLGVAWMTR